MVDVPVGTILSFVAPQLAILAVASLVSFRLYHQRQSRGFFLIFLGIFIKLVVDATWELSYWIVIFPFIFNTQFASVSQIERIFGLVNLVSVAITGASLVVMLTLILYGASKITKEHPAAAEPIPQP